MSFPQCVSHLILASPIGIPEEPEHTEAPELIMSSGRVRDFALYMWDRGYTPQSLVRLIGPMGRRPINTYITRRFRSRQQAKAEEELDLSAAIVCQIDKGKLKLPKENIAEYLVCCLFVFLSFEILFFVLCFSIIYVLNLVVVNLDYHFL